MEIIVNPDRSRWQLLCRRNIPDDQEIEQSVKNIIEEVRLNGDEALIKFAREFDGVENLQLRVSKEEVAEAQSKISSEVKSALKVASQNISLFHESQLPREVKAEVQPGVTCIQRAVPIKRVGLYIPGGRAPLFSTVLMLALPAKIAGCKEIVLCTPRRKDGSIANEILAAAALCGVSEIYGIGGAQAIAAMAYGTQTIQAVNKIFGPGNRYVTKAKMMVTHKVAIDMPAGPSEVLVMADETGVPDFVAADLLSQAEHGPDSQAILVCRNEDFAKRVFHSIKKLEGILTRKDSIQKSLSQSRAIVFDSLENCIDFVNDYAPEHLIISTKDPWDVADKITAAGSIFIGNFSPESAGDYASGTNHTLPTSGWAAAYSGVNIDSFMHKITYQELTPKGLQGLGKTIVAMAHAEGLDAHALAVDIRLNTKQI